MAFVQRLLSDILISAAESVLPDPATLQPSSYATWASTRREDEFDAASVIRYLRREGHEPHEALLTQYGKLSRNVIGLREINTFAPWLECVGTRFVNYASFQQLRETPRFVEILTFTTPAVSPARDLAFLEVWTEDGRYPEMGMWWWIHLRYTKEGWRPDWRHIHAIS